MNLLVQDPAIYGPEQVRAAYARLAAIYDYLFGPMLNQARLAAVRAVNALPGADVLEVGVGTGLALPHYRPDKRITGIDLSSEMLSKARTRAARLANVESLLKMDAQVTSFADNQFDIAAVMFVASVVPDPLALMAELRRVVKPGGHIVILNHFATDHGILGWLENAATPVCVKLGWHADFRLDDLLSPSDLQEATTALLRPFGLFRLVNLTN
jgi:phosphatidylethanolamine/phosphatidyl-N-methylethanolamine N-methyltransferase